MSKLATAEGDSWMASACEDRASVREVGGWQEDAERHRLVGITTSSPCAGKPACTMFNQLSWCRRDYIWWLYSPPDYRSPASLPQGGIKEACGELELIRYGRTNQEGGGQGQRAQG